MKILVISGHPNLSQSVNNKLILDRLKSRFNEDIEIRDLGALYPDYRFDIQAEQQAMIAADVIVWQFPFYWFSMPALMKKWLDDVFGYGFAYGGDGSKLAGKPLIVSFTAGGKAEEYRDGGAEGAEIPAFYPPLKSTAHLTQMQWREPVYSTNVLYIPNVSSDEELAQVQTRAQDHADRLILAIEAAAER
ncbi:putative NADPH-quinone reductase [Cricetibacter osteomyelitidis]|uniref:Putative NADPH-quinone reductase n=1 Tax=Cricetibacter osteomyelitidis TaxID=1521931 RepID=A0A4R2T589_9PAST|nr:NAD(P)H-dependent oxidoreductase [Cricetibacter osteomyelitidis]TCP95994.1 putative NADPH-quinone reductase [Cricetibacter osteomyelitidis]